MSENLIDRLEGLQSQLTRLINAASSMVNSCPEFPPTSRPWTAREFLMSEIVRAIRVLEGKPPTMADESETQPLAGGGGV